MNIITRSELLSARRGRDSGISADDVVRLAHGEHLGARHDHALEALMASPAALAAFRIARAIAADAETLASDVERARGGNVRRVDFGRSSATLPARRSPAAWAAAAAIGFVAAGLTLRGIDQRELMMDDATREQAVFDRAASDVIFASDDGGQVAPARSNVDSDDDIFVDAFGG